MRVFSWAKHDVDCVTNTKKDQLRFLTVDEARGMEDDGHETLAEIHGISETLTLYTVHTLDTYIHRCIDISR